MFCPQIYAWFVAKRSLNKDVLQAWHDQDPSPHKGHKCHAKNGVNEHETKTVCRICDHLKIAVFIFVVVF